MTQKEYREITGFPGYKVGSDGSVWSCWRKRGIGGTTHGTVSYQSERWVQLKFDKKKSSGYLRVALTSPSKKVCRFLVHRLVLEAFVGPCPQGMQCRHFPDRDTANNRLENLAWGTKEENQDDKNKHGTNARGEAAGRAILKNKDIPEIRRLMTVGLTHKRIAAIFGVSETVISNIKTKRIWSHIPN